MLRRACSRSPHHLPGSPLTHCHHHPVGLGQRAPRQRERDAQAQEPAGRDERRAAREHAQQRKQQLARQRGAVALEAGDVLAGGRRGEAAGVGGPAGMASGGSRRHRRRRRRPPGGLGGLPAGLPALPPPHPVMLQALGAAAALRAGLGQQAAALHLQRLEARWHRAAVVGGHRMPSRCAARWLRAQPLPLRARPPQALPLRSQAIKESIKACCRPLAWGCRPQQVAAAVHEGPLMSSGRPAAAVAHVYVALVIRGALDGGRLAQLPPDDRGTRPWPRVRRRCAQLLHCDTTTLQQRRQAPWLRQGCGGGRRRRRRQKPPSILTPAA